MARSRTEPHRNTTSENYAALSERVANLGNAVSNLSSEVEDIRGSMASAAAVREVSSKLESLGTKLEERNKTQWPTLIAGGGFILAIMSVIGTLAYRPIETEQARLQARQDRFEERYIGDLKAKINSLSKRSSDSAVP